MPYKKRGAFSFRRRARKFGRRRFTRRRYTQAKRINRYSVHHFKEVVSSLNQIGVGPTINQVTTAVTTAELILQFQDLGNAGSLSSVYDEYKINKVICKFYPMVTGNVSVVDTSGAATAQNNGLFRTIMDSDGSPPVTASGFMQYDSYKCQSTSSPRPIVRVCRPRNLIAGQISGGVNSSIRPVKSGWCDMANQNVQHYLMAFLIDQATGTANRCQSYDLQLTVYYSCRHQR